MLDIIERQITEKGWLSLSTLYFDNAYSIDVYNTRGAVAYSKADQCFFALNALDSTDTAIVEHKVAVYDNHHIGNQVNLTVSGEEHLQHYDIALYAHYRLLFNDMDLRGNDIFYDNVTVAEALLIPTKIYSSVVQHVVSKVNVKGMVHITGGGFYDNIPRVLPKDISAEIDLSQVELPKVIAKFKEISNIDEYELYRVFNMGIGYIFVVSEIDKDKVIESAAKKGEKAFVIGRTVKGSNDVKIKGIDID